MRDRTLYPLAATAWIVWTGMVVAGDSGRLPAFPGAKGFGAHTLGGRGGRVLEVTNLNDSGPGSLRAAIETLGPRIVVFRTGGTIEVQSPLRITHPFITIAGQTAPGSGIALKNAATNLYAPLRVKTHDVVVRYQKPFALHAEKTPGFSPGDALAPG